MSSIPIEAFEAGDLDRDEAAAEFLEGVRDDLETGDRVDLHDGEADPIQLVIGPGTPAADYHLLFQRLRALDYQVEKEWDRGGNEVSQAAYRLHFPDERGESA